MTTYDRKPNVTVDVKHKDLLSQLREDQIDLGPVTYPPSDPGQVLKSVSFLVLTGDNNKACLVGPVFGMGTICSKLLLMARSFLYVALSLV